MILSYRDRRTEAFAQGHFVREFQSFASQAYRRLEILDAATGLHELRALRSNRLEALKALVLASIAYESTCNGASASNGRAQLQANVEIVDYH
jgi:toxin HigB-1